MMVGKFQKIILGNKAKSSYLFVVILKYDKF